MFNLNFALLYHHKIDFRIFDDMIPWEKEAYIGLLSAKIKEENENTRLKELENRARSTR